MLQYIPLLFFIFLSCSTPKNNLQEFLDKNPHDLIVTNKYLSAGLVLPNKQWERYPDILATRSGDDISIKSKLEKFPPISSVSIRTTNFTLKEEYEEHKEWLKEFHKVKIIDENVSAEIGGEKALGLICQQGHYLRKDYFIRKKMKGYHNIFIVSVFISDNSSQQIKNEINQIVDSIVFMN